MRRRVEALPAIVDSFSLTDTPAFRGIEFGGRAATGELLREVFPDVPLIEIASTLPELAWM